MRKYFISINNKIRATIDNNIFYKNLKYFHDFNISKFDLNPIIEIKYQTINDNEVRSNLKNLTLRMSKNSKYFNSILKNS